MCKYIDPKQSGASIPVLCLNTFKGDHHTIFGSMDDAELCCLFTGYGYQPCIVDDMHDIDRELHTTLSWAIETVREIQLNAKARVRRGKPRWPIIILRIPKDWGYPKLGQNEHLTGSFHGHEILLPHAKINQRELQHLQDWLTSYRPADIFLGDRISDNIERILPPYSKLRLGQNRLTWDVRQHLDVPEWRHFGVAKGNYYSCLKAAAVFLDETLTRNKNSLRIFSPDGLISKNLDKISDRPFRSFRWNEDNINKGEQVIEFTSEHTCQGKWTCCCRQ